MGGAVVGGVVGGTVVGGVVGGAVVGKGHMLTCIHQIT